MTGSLSIGVDPYYGEPIREGNISAPGGAAALGNGWGGGGGGCSFTRRCSPGRPRAAVLRSRSRSCHRQRRTSWKSGPPLHPTTPTRREAHPASQAQRPIIIKAYAPHLLVEAPASLLRVAGAEHLHDLVADHQLVAFLIIGCARCTQTHTRARANTRKSVLSTMNNTSGQGAKFTGRWTQGNARARPCHVKFHMFSAS
jgi:hypothetical protein